MSAGERLDSQMYPLVPFQVMISIEALRTLITLERAVVRDLLLMRMAEEMSVRHTCCMPAVEP